MKLSIDVTYSDGTLAKFELVSKNVEAHSVMTDNPFLVGLLAKDIFWETKFKDKRVVEVSAQPEN